MSLSIRGLLLTKKPQFYLPPLPSKPSSHLARPGPSRERLPTRREERPRWGEREKVDPDELDIQVNRRRELYKHGLFAKARYECSAHWIVMCLTSPIAYRLQPPYPLSSKPHPSADCLWPRTRPTRLSIYSARVTHLAISWCRVLYDLHRFVVADDRYTLRSGRQTIIRLHGYRRVP